MYQRIIIITTTIIIIAELRCLCTYISLGTFTVLCAFKSTPYYVVRVVLSDFFYEFISEEKQVKKDIWHSISFSNLSLLSFNKKS